MFRRFIYTIISMPNALQPTEAYCTNPALTSPFISRGDPRQTA
jgi:hypothetical protein